MSEAWQPEIDGGFNVFLHSLRTRELQRMPGGARTILSAGCAGRWYFDWVRESYPGIERHLGVEAFSPRPEDLPPEAEWIADRLGAMRSVSDGTVDLVFGGQTVEHLWPPELADFLAEAHRVLRPGGFLVLDSPNRSITDALGWWQPEHTAELTVDEISALLRLAGFELCSVRGVWLCYDRDGHRLLPLDHDVPSSGLDREARWRLAEERPEDSFVWWVEARRADAPPAAAALAALADEIYDRDFGRMTRRAFSQVGRASGSGASRMIETARGESGYALYGPYVPLRPGRYRARFAVGLPRSERRRLADWWDDAPVCRLDVSVGGGNLPLAVRELRPRDLRAGRLAEVDLDFDLESVAFGVELRSFSTGRRALVLGAPATLVALDEVARRLS